MVFGLPRRVVTDYGARGFPADDTAAIQRAIDSAHARGGDIVHVPGGRWMVSQLIVRPYVYLKGIGFLSTGRAGVGTRLMQPPGSTQDMIRFSDNGFPPGWAGPCGVSDMTLVGYDGAGGRGIAFLGPAGQQMKMQDGTVLARLMVRGFHGDGIYMQGGGPILLRQIQCMYNGGYGLRIANPAGVNDHSAQALSIVDFSGDANNGGAAIRMENVKAPYGHSLVGIKSEQRINTDRGNATAQPHVIEFHNCAHAVAITGLQHISATTTNTKPGDAIVVTGPARPVIDWRAAGVRVLPHQVDGADPVLIRDMTDGQTVPITRRHGSYDGTRPVLNYSRAGESQANAQLRAALAYHGLVTDSTVE